MKSKENILGNILLMTLIVLVLLPMVAVLFQIVCPGLNLANFDLANLSELSGIITKKTWNTAFKNSLMLGVTTTMTGLCVATLMAHLRVKYVFYGRKWIDLTAWILMIIPSFLLAQGWIYFAAGNGIAKSWLGIENLSKFVYSFQGLAVIMTLCKFPLAYIAVKNVLEWYPDSLIQAARMNGANPLKVWLSIQGPLCIPAFLSAAMLIFMDTIGDYGMSSTITAAFPFATLPYTIYSAICTSVPRFDMAGILSLYLILLILMAMAIQNISLGKRRFDFLGSDAVQVIPKRLSKIKTFLLSIFTGAFCLVALGIPIGSNFIMSFSSSISIEKFTFTLDNYKAIIQTGDALMSGLINSLTIAACAAVVGVLIGFLVAYTLTYSRYQNRKIIDSITLMAMAVPGVVMGIGYIFVWNQAWLSDIGLPVYGKPTILLLASIAVAVPLANRILVAGMAKIPNDLMLAAQVQGAGMFYRIKTILLPLLHTSSVSAILSVFGVSVFNLAITTLLYPPNFSTLPVYISKQYNNLNFGYSSAATILGGICIVCVMLIMEKILNYANRHTKFNSQEENR